MRATNSAGVFASRSWTDASPKPPLRKCTCVSMKPGTSIMPRASITRVVGAVSLRTSAPEPTATMRSPAAATASAHGRRESPVQTRALTTAMVGACARALSGSVTIVERARRPARTLRMESYGS
jgi:hypothetical protein